MAHRSRAASFEFSTNGLGRIFDDNQSVLLRHAHRLVHVRHLDSWTLARQQNAARYERLFVESGLKVTDTSHYSTDSFASGATDVFLPKVMTGRHIFNQYVIRVARRDELKAALESRGVGTEVYYPVPMHLQECFDYLGHSSGSFPHSEGAARETLALPIYPELSEDQARHVVQCVRDFFAAGS